MAAVDGGLSLDTPTMMKVLTRLRSSVVIPMHWFGPTLPGRPTIMVLNPAFYNPLPE